MGKPFEVGSGGVYTVALIDPSTTVDLSDVSNPLSQGYTNAHSQSHPCIQVQRKIIVSKTTLVLKIIRY